MSKSSIECRVLTINDGKTEHVVPREWYDMCTWIYSEVMDGLADLSDFVEVITFRFVEGGKPRNIKTLTLKMFVSLVVGEKKLSVRKEQTIDWHNNEFKVYRREDDSVEWPFYSKEGNAKDLITSIQKKAGEHVEELFSSAQRINDLLKSPIPLSSGQETLEVLRILEGYTCAIQITPNCPSPYLVRFPGESGIIDFKYPPHESGDCIGIGESLAGAAQLVLEKNTT